MASDGPIPVHEDLVEAWAFELDVNYSHLEWLEIGGPPDLALPAALQEQSEDATNEELDSMLKTWRVRGWN